MTHKCNCDCCICAVGEEEYKNRKHIDDFTWGYFLLKIDYHNHNHTEVYEQLYGFSKKFCPFCYSNDAFAKDGLPSTVRIPEIEKKVAKAVLN